MNIIAYLLVFGSAAVESCWIRLKRNTRCSYFTVLTVLKPDSGERFLDLCRFCFDDEYEAFD